MSRLRATDSLGVGLDMSGMANGFSVFPNDRSTSIGSVRERQIDHDTWSVSAPTYGAGPAFRQMEMHITIGRTSVVLDNFYARDADGDVTLSWERADIRLDASLLGDPDTFVFLGFRTNDTIIGNRYGDHLRGGAGRDALIGNAGNDALYGESGNDVLNGGAGRDLLGGGSGADRFVFSSASDSRPNSSGRDVVKDFTSADVIDLSDIDANAKASGNQSFRYGGSSFDERAGELVFKRGLLSGDTDGDGDADFQIHLSGVTRLSMDDVLL